MRVDGPGLIGFRGLQPLTRTAKLRVSFGGQRVDESNEEQPRGRVDLTAKLYIAGGLPVLVGFLFVLFLLAGNCNIPA